MLVATNAGLTRLESGKAITYTVRDGFADARQRVLLEDRDGAVWVGGYNGLAQLRDGRFRVYGPSDGLTDGYVLSLFEDRQGTLWVGTQSAGLLRRADGRFVSAGADFERQPIFHITEDADGTLWVGTSRGLARLRDGRVHYFTVRDGLHSNTIFHALDDGAGHLWLSSLAGVARVARANLDAVADGRERLMTVRQFGSSDGMASRESTQIARGWRSEDGRLWFPTPAGLALVDPRGSRTTPSRRWCMSSRWSPTAAPTTGRSDRPAGGHAQDRVPLHLAELRLAGAAALPLPAGRLRPRVGGRRPAAGS